MSIIRKWKHEKSIVLTYDNGWIHFTKALISNTIVDGNNRLCKHMYFRIIYSTWNFHLCCVPRLTYFNSGFRVLSEFIRKRVVWTARFVENFHRYRLLSSVYKQNLTLGSLIRFTFNYFTYFSGYIQNIYHILVKDRTS